LATFTFRNIKYDSDLLDKLSSEGHVLDVNKDDIVHAHTGIKTRKPVAIKVDSKYHLLQGSLDTKHNKPALLVITKFTLKKCKVETPISSSTNSFQDRWNQQNPSQRYTTNNTYSKRPN
jgi:hypothetical protein